MAVRVVEAWHQQFIFSINDHFRVFFHHVHANRIKPAFELVGVEGYQPDEEMVALAVEHEILIALEALIRIDAE